MEEEVERETYAVGLEIFKGIPGCLWYARLKERYSEVLDQMIEIINGNDDLSEICYILRKFQRVFCTQPIIPIDTIMRVERAVFNFKINYNQVFRTVNLPEPLFTLAEHQQVLRRERAPIRINQPFQATIQYPIAIGRFPSLVPVSSFAPQPVPPPMITPTPQPVPPPHVTASQPASTPKPVLPTLFTAPQHFPPSFVYTPQPIPPPLSLPTPQHVPLQPATHLPLGVPSFQPAMLTPRTCTSQPTLQLQSMFTPQPLLTPVSMSSSQPVSTDVPVSQLLSTKSAVFISTSVDQPVSTIVPVPVPPPSLQPHSSHQISLINPPSSLNANTRSDINHLSTIDITQPVEIVQHVGPNASESSQTEMLNLHRANVSNTHNEKELASVTPYPLIRDSFLQKNLTTGINVNGNVRSLLSLPFPPGTDIEKAAGSSQDYSACEVDTRHNADTRVSRSDNLNSIDSPASICKTSVEKKLTSRQKVLDWLESVNCLEENSNSSSNQNESRDPRLNRREKIESNSVSVSFSSSSYDELATSQLFISSDGADLLSKYNRNGQQINDAFYCMKQSHSAQNANSTFSSDREIDILNRLPSQKTDTPNSDIYASQSHVSGNCISSQLMSCDLSNSSINMCNGQQREMDSGLNTTTKAISIRKKIVKQTKVMIHQENDLPLSTQNGMNQSNIRNLDEHSDDVTSKVSESIGNVNARGYKQQYIEINTNENVAVLQENCFKETEKSSDNLIQNQGQIDENLNHRSSENSKQNLNNKSKKHIKKSETLTESNELQSFYDTGRKVKGKSSNIQPIASSSDDSEMKNTNVQATVSDESINIDSAYMPATNPKYNVEVRNIEKDKDKAVIKEHKESLGTVKSSKICNEPVNIREKEFGKRKNETKVDVQTENIKFVNRTDNDKLVNRSKENRVYNSSKYKEKNENKTNQEQRSKDHSRYSDGFDNENKKLAIGNKRNSNSSAGVDKNKRANMNESHSCADEITSSNAASTIKKSGIKDSKQCNTHNSRHHSRADEITSSNAASTIKKSDIKDSKQCNTHNSRRHSSAVEIVSSNTASTVKKNDIKDSKQSNTHNKNYHSNASGITNSNANGSIKKSDIKDSKQSSTNNKKYRSNAGGITNSNTNSTIKKNDIKDSKQSKIYNKKCHLNAGEITSSNTASKIKKSVIQDLKQSNTYNKIQVDKSYERTDTVCGNISDKDTVEYSSGNTNINYKDDEHKKENNNKKKEKKFDQNGKHIKYSEKKGKNTADYNKCIQKKSTSERNNKEKTLKENDKSKLENSKQRKKIQEQLKSAGHTIKSNSCEIYKRVMHNDHSTLDESSIGEEEIGDLYSESANEQTSVNPNSPARYLSDHNHHITLPRNDFSIKKLTSTCDSGVINTIPGQVVAEVSASVIEQDQTPLKLAVETSVVNCLEKSVDLAEKQLSYSSLNASDNLCQIIEINKINDNSKQMKECPTENTITMKGPSDMSDRENQSSKSVLDYSQSVTSELYTEHLKNQNYMDSDFTDSDLLDILLENSHSHEELTSITSENKTNENNFSSDAKENSHMFIPDNNEISSVTVFRNSESPITSNICAEFDNNAKNFTILNLSKPPSAVEKDQTTHLKSLLEGLIEKLELTFNTPVLTNTEKTVPCLTAHSVDSVSNINIQPPATFVSTKEQGLNTCENSISAVHEPFDNTHVSDTNLLSPSHTNSNIFLQEDDLQFPANIKNKINGKNVSSDATENSYNIPNLVVNVNTHICALSAELREIVHGILSIVNILSKNNAESALDSTVNTTVSAVTKMLDVLVVLNQVLGLVSDKELSKSPDSREDAHTDVTSYTLDDRNTVEPVFDDRETRFICENHVTGKQIEDTPSKSKTGVMAKRENISKTTENSDISVGHECMDSDVIDIQSRKICSYSADNTLVENEHHESSVSHDVAPPVKCSDSDHTELPRNEVAVICKCKAPLIGYVFHKSFCSHNLSTNRDAALDQIKSIQTSIENASSDVTDNLNVINTGDDHIVPCSVTNTIDQIVPGSVSLIRNTKLPNHISSTTDILLENTDCTSSVSTCPEKSVRNSKTFPTQPREESNACEGTADTILNIPANVLPTAGENVSDKLCDFLERETSSSDEVQNLHTPTLQKTTSKISNVTESDPASRETCNAEPEDSDFDNITLLPEDTSFENINEENSRILISTDTTNFKAVSDEPSNKQHDINLENIVVTGETSKLLDHSLDAESITTTVSDQSNLFVLVKEITLGYFEISNSTVLPSEMKEDGVILQTVTPNEDAAVLASHQTDSGHGASTDNDHQWLGADKKNICFNKRKTNTEETLLVNKKMKESITDGMHGESCSKSDGFNASKLCDTQSSNSSGDHVRLKASCSDRDRISRGNLSSAGLPITSSTTLKNRAQYLKNKACVTEGSRSTGNKGNSSFLTIPNILSKKRKKKVEKKHEHIKKLKVGKMERNVELCTGNSKEKVTLPEKAKKNKSESSISVSESNSKKQEKKT